MSWIDDNFDDLQAMDLQAISQIEDNLDDKNIEKICKAFENRYVFLVADILTKFKNGNRLTDKQKRCVAKYLFENDLEDIIKWK